MKKGSVILFMVFEMVVVVLVVFLTSTYAKDLATSERSEMVGLINNIDLMLDTLVTVSGNVVVEYPYLITDYNVFIDGNKILIENKAKDKREVKNFFLLKDYEVTGAFVGGRLCMVKTDKTIFLRECKDE